jgi:hypothetical protein
MNNQPKHTPAPWYVTNDSDGPFIHVVAYTEANPNIVSVGLHNGIKQAEADARLIASAPEMLEVLYEAQALIGDYVRSRSDDDDDDETRIYQMVKDVINKIEKGANHD